MSTFSLLSTKIHLFILSYILHPLDTPSDFLQQRGFTDYDFAEQLQELSYGPDAKLDKVSESVCTDFSELWVSSPLLVMQTST